MKQLKPDAHLPGDCASSIDLDRQSLQQQNSVPRLTLLSTGYGTSTLSAGIGGTFTSSQYVPYIESPQRGSAPAAQAFRNAMTTYEPEKPSSPSPLRMDGQPQTCLYTRCSWPALAQPRPVSSPPSVQRRATTLVVSPPTRYSSRQADTDGNPLNCLYIMSIITPVSASRRRPFACDD